MSIQDSDLFLIEDTSGGSNKIEASKLKANLAANTYNDYLLLVNKSDYSACFVKAQNMQGSVEPTDYMMIERGGVSYSVTGQQIIDYFPSIPAGQAGPITESGVKNQLTLASDDNVSDFVNGDAINMVDVDGAVASYVPVTSTITNVSQSSDYQTTTTGPNQNGVLNPAYPSDFFSERHVNAYNALAVGASLYDIGYFSASSATSGDNQAHMIISPGLSVSPSDVIEHGFRTYGYTTPIIFNEIYTVAIGSSENGFGSIKGTTVPCDMTAFFAAGETEITSVTITGGPSGAQCGILQLLVNGEMAGAKVLTTLTTTNDQDLKYFKPGDVVQTDSSVPGTYIGYTASGYSQTDIYQIAISAATSQGEFTYGSTPTGGPNGLDAVLFDLGFPTAGAEFGSLDFTPSANIELYASDTGLQDSWQLEDTGSTNDDGEGTVKSTNSYRYYKLIKTTGGLGYGSMGFQYWGVTADSFVGQPISITGIKTSAPSVTVDGGDWTGSDGTISNPNGYASWNQTQNWSSNTTGTTYNNGGYGKEQMFDGFLDSRGQPNGTLTFTPSTPIVFNRNFKIYAAKYGSGGTYTVNGVDIRHLIPSTPGWFDLTDAVSSPITQIVMGGTGNNLCSTNAMMADNALLADPTEPWDQSKMWSSNSTETNIITAANGWHQAFSGRTNYPVYSVNKAYNSGTVTFDPPLTASPKVFAAGAGINFDTGGSSVEVDDGNGFTRLAITGIYPAGYPSQEFTFTAIHAIRITTINSSNYGLVTGVENDGKLLVNSDVAGGPEGTGEKEVTGPFKSGTGNFNGNTGPVVDVTNSNGDWIDNQNRLGTDFYIKAASTRTGLSVLRAKAIAQAQAWVASDNYIADQLVTYNGSYWLALASNDSNSPDTTDELEWFDLGAIEG